MHKYIIMGAQGCGKGTQAKMLNEAYDLVHISVGDVFRWNLQAHTKLAARITRIMSEGQLVPDEIVEEIVRIQARRLCSDCGLDYNLIFHRPVNEGVCDVCGGSLIRRSDDNDTVVRSRLDDFHAKTQPIVDLFRRKELVVVVDGTRAPLDIHDAIRRRLQLRTAGGDAPSGS